MAKLDLGGEVKVTVEEPAAPTTDSEPDEAKEAKDRRIAVSGTLATGVTVLVSALGLFGGLTGTMARLARNFPVWTGIAVGLVVLSVALAIAARLVAPGKGKKKAPCPVPESRQPYWSTALLWLSGFAFLVGMGIAIVVVTMTIGKDDLPSVSAQSTRDATSGVVSIAGTAKAGGLAAEDAVRVSVVAFPEGETKLGTQLYYAVVGPSPDGVVDHAFTVIVPREAVSVVVSAAKDTADADGVPTACKPEKDVDEPVEAEQPVKVESEGREQPAACAQITVPSLPAALTQTSASHGRSR